MNDLALFELQRRLRWFVTLRWIAAAAVAVGTLVLWGPLAIPVSVAPLLAIAAIIASYNVFFWMQANEIARQGEARRAVFAANAQISADLLALTALLHFAGGADNPLFLYYIFHISIAGILLSSRDTYLQATLAVLLFSGLVISEYTGLLPPVAIPSLFGVSCYSSPAAVATVLLAFASTLYLTAYLETSIVGELRNAERELVTLRENVETSARQLRVAYDKLRDTERFKSEYMRKVGHELRAPLGAAQSLLSTVLEDLAGTVPERAKALLQRVYIRNQELLNLVNDLLVLARLQEPAAKPTKELLDISEIARRVADLFEPEAKKKGLDFQVVIPTGLPKILGNRDEMEQLLSNLVSNAIKYTPAGGRVELNINLEPGRLVFNVSDTGIGIEPAEVPKLFQEFYRTPRARELAAEGTGLGLAIVKAIVDAFGGSVEVQSTPGQGSRFTVSIPTSGETERETRGITPEQEGPSPGEAKDRTSLSHVRVPELRPASESMKRAARGWRNAPQVA